MRQIAVIGAGAVGSLVGGLLARAGESVTLINLWPPHVDHLKKEAPCIKTSEGECSVKVDIHHIYEIAGLHRELFW